MAGSPAIRDRLERIVALHSRAAAILRANRMRSEAARAERFEARARLMLDEPEATRRMRALTQDLYEAPHAESLLERALEGAMSLIGGDFGILALDGFHESFCADVPADDAAFYAISQRPLAGVALTEAAGTPAWRSRPVWAVLPTADGAIDPGVHRFSYERMGARVTEVEGASHVVMISHPKEVAEVVMTAVRTCAAQPA